MGEIEVPIQICPFTFEITFQVMDIKPAYNCFLGKPWIHSTGVVPSFLHQKLKFIMNDKLVTVSGKKDTLVSSLAPAHCRGNLRSYWNLLPVFKGHGLGKGLKGVVRLANERKEKRLAHSKGRELRATRIPICVLYQSFRSRGLVHTNQVTMVKEDQNVDDRVNLVYPCGPHEELHNWEIIEFPMTFNSLSKSVEQEDKIIQSHEEKIEMINLGNENDKKEVKIGTPIRGSERENLIKLLSNYVDIFT
ncbi:hypothetical protein CR513_61163, partial [Mucuna pruriens]